MLQLLLPFLLTGSFLPAHPKRILDSPHLLLLYFPLQPLSHKPQPARKLPPKKDMKEQEKEGSDSKESLKTKSDESGEEKNGDEDCQRAGQKKKGE